MAHHSRRAPVDRRRRPILRPGLEPLEPRWVPTILWIGGDGGGLWNDPNNWRDPTAPPDRDHRTPSATLNDNVSLPAHGIFVVNDIGAQRL